MSSKSLFTGFLLMWASLGGCMASVHPQTLGFRDIGCFVSGNGNKRDLLGLLGVTALGPYTTLNGVTIFVQHDSMTLDVCAQICAYGRFRYFGANNKLYCTCDSTFGSLGAASESECNNTCPGNSSQVCGARFRNSIYEISYPKLGQTMTKLSVASMPQISARTSSITHRSVKARSLSNCALACQNSPHCLGCAFIPSSQMCRLLKFFAVPAEVAGEAEWVWMKL